MPGAMPIPGHITAIYVFAVVNLMALFHITLVEANLIVLDRLNKTIEELPDKAAQFGPSFPDGGLWGHIATTKPSNACLPIAPPPTDNSSGINWIALIRRHDCNFDEKVLHAQQRGYAAALIYNVGSDELIPMGPGKHGEEITIPSAFIGERDAAFLSENFDKKTDFFIVLDNDAFPDVNIYLIPFAIVVGICFILMLVFMIVKWVRDIRKRRRSRLSKEKLQKLPIKKFKKGDHYDVCAICLDEYEEGEKLRVLPCAHAYHMKCVDPWLTKNKRTCPVCKRKVIPGDHEDSESDSESEDEGHSSENTPLLTGQTAGQVPRYHHAYPGTMEGEPSSSVSDTNSTADGAVGGTPSSQSLSAVDVHPTPSPSDSGLAPSRASRSYGAITPTQQVMGSPAEGSSELGAVGGASETDSNVDFTDDYYSEQEMKGLVSGDTSGEDRKPHKDPLKVRVLKSKKGSKKRRSDSNNDGDA